MRFLLLLLPALARAHLTYVRTPRQLEDFKAQHESYRLIYYREDNLHSLKLLKKSHDSLIPTAAVLSTEGAIPRVEMGGKRRLGAAAENVFEYGRHGITAQSDHWLMLVGLQIPAQSIAMFARAAEEKPGVPHIYARAEKSVELMRAFAFKPYMKNQVHKIVNGKAVHSFEFNTKEEFDEGLSNHP